MKQKKREYIPLYSFYDRSGVSKHLEEMAAKGWLLEKLNGFYWQYRRIEPQQLRFSVTYFPKATQFAPAPVEGLETFWELCAETGWILAADNAQVQVFYNEDSNATPIETDPESDFQTIRRAMKKGAVSSYWTLLALSLFECGFLFWRLFDDPIDQFSNALQLNSTFGFVPLALLSAVELIRYYRWQKRCRAALESGGALPELRSARWLSILILVLVAFQLLTLFSTSLSFSIGMAVTMIFMLLYICLMFFLANSIRKTLQRLHVKSWINKAVTVGALVALMIGMFSGMIALVFKTSGSWFEESEDVTTYEVNGHTFKQYHDVLPLTVGDLVPDGYENWSTQLQTDSTFLLTHIEAHQRGRVGDPAIPDLSYEVVIVKAPFLYDLCKKDFIDWLERDNDKLPEEHWDVYQPVDPTPWGAVEVYQRYSSGEPINQFLICWPDRIAEIDFDWNWIITEQMISTAAEHLKRA